MNEKQNEIIELINASPLFETQEEKNEWINQVVPKMTEKDLAQTKNILLEAKKTNDEFQAKRLEEAKKRYEEIKQASEKLKKIILQEKEKKSDREDEEEVQSLDAELEGI